MPKDAIQNEDTGAPICDIDFFGDEYVIDPVKAYHQMLEKGPVVWLPQNNLHAIVGFEALTTSLRNHRVFRSGKGVSINEKINEFLIGSTLNSDPPDHDETRAITFGPLTPRALAEARQRIETEAKAIADKVVEMQEFDAVKDLATHLPLTIVRDLVGLGDYGKEKMLDWAGASFQLMGDPRERREVSIEKMGELAKFLNDPDMLGALKQDGWARRATRLAMEAGIEEKRAIALMRDYIAPSLDTTISAISFGLMLFAKHPDQWTKLRADRSLVRNAIEEIVRLNTPIKTLSRWVEEDIDIGDVTLKKDNRVMMMFGAANRDPAQFEDPDTFDIERSTRGHVGFGHGKHACLGMHLARLEMTSLFNALADRIERFEINGVKEQAIISVIFSLERLPMRIAS
ncbi:cytochrome P450 [Planktotalea sp.]|uniref:cytochrome P450 n=1 Tax=Planktotalea sp. TaxID=2029877 RepID=UPI0035C81725